MSFTFLVCALLFTIIIATVLTMLLLLEPYRTYQVSTRALAGFGAWLLTLIWIIIATSM